MLYSLRALLLFGLPPTALANTRQPDPGPVDDTLCTIVSSTCSAPVVSQTTRCSYAEKLMLYDNRLNCRSSAARRTQHTPEAEAISAATHPSGERQLGCAGAGLINKRGGRAIVVLAFEVCRAACIHAEWLESMFNVRGECTKSTESTKYAASKQGAIGFYASYLRFISLCHSMRQLVVPMIVAECGKRLALCRIWEARPSPCSHTGPKLSTHICN